MTRWETSLPAGQQSAGDGERKFGTVLTAAIAAGALLLTYAGGQALFAPAPPMLARAARASTIGILFAIHYLVLFVAARAAQSFPARWPVAARGAAIGLVAISGAALLSFASFFAFLLVHALCYVAGACAISILPEQIIHAINVATTYPFVESCVVLPLIVGLAGVRSARRSAGAGAASDGP